jgi:hypothetical protein
MPATVSSPGALRRCDNPIRHRPHASSRPAQHCYSGSRSPATSRRQIEAHPRSPGITAGPQRHFALLPHRKHLRPIPGSARRAGNRTSLTRVFPIGKQSPVFPMGKAGSPRAFQPEAPTDPYVNLSVYTAPVTLFTRHSGRRAPIPSARTYAGTVQRSHANTGRLSPSPAIVCTSRFEISNGLSDDFSSPTRLLPDKHPVDRTNTPRMT